MQKPIVLVIDGQGGRIGKLLIEQLSHKSDQIELICVGTNSIATSVMMKAGASRGGTGENAVIVNCRSANYIIGPLGIVIADSVMGEITPDMARAVGQSSAHRLLIPLNLCGNIVVGLPNIGIKELIALTIKELERLLASGDEALRSPSPFPS